MAKKTFDKLCLKDIIYWIDDRNDNTPTIQSDTVKTLSLTNDDMIEITVSNDETFLVPSFEDYFQTETSQDFFVLALSKEKVKTLYTTDLIGKITYYNNKLEEFRKEN